MAASVRINRHNGAGAVATNISAAGNTVVNMVDSHQTTAAGSTNPIPIPPLAGTTLSWWCVTRLEATTAPTGIIKNIRWYTNGTNNWGTGVSASGNAASAYTQATGTSTNGTLLNTTNYASLVAAPVNVSTFTVGSPRTIAGSTTVAAQFGNYFVYQFAVLDTAIPGVTTAQTFTWAYDET
jgi:hypothetical protein